MNFESSSITPFIFTAFKKLAKEKPYRELGPYAEISLKILKELGQQDLSNARGVNKEWKQLIEQTEEWKKLYSKIAVCKVLEENQNTGDKSSLLDPSYIQWNDHQIAKSLGHNPAAIIDNSIVAKVNTAANYLSKEGFKLKGVPSDGDCFFSAFLGSYNCLSRKIPLLDGSPDKVFYLRQVLSDMVKYTNKGRAEKIKGKRTWISGLGEGDLLATALSIPIRLVTLNEEQLTCGIHDRLIFPKASSSMEDNSQEWKTIPEEKKPEEYVLIIDLGGHFIYAQKLLGQDNPFFLNQTASPTARFSKSRYLYPHDKASRVAKTGKNKNFLTTRQNFNKRGKNDTFDPSSPLATLPLKIFKQIFHSFSNLTEHELRKILDVRSCARVFKQYMPNNVKFLQLYQPKKLQSYLDKLSNYLDKTFFSRDGSNNFLSVERLEEDYTHALKLAIQKEDPFRIRFCIEKLGDIHLIKGTSQTLLQAAGLYNYALHKASLGKQAIIKEKLSKVEILLSKACKREPVDILIIKKQFENNRDGLKKFRDEIEKKIQTLGSDPSSEEVRMLYKEIAQWIKVFFKNLVDQAQEVLGAAPCEYAMIGFGSLAREEMTPYSDLEFGILIRKDSKDNRKYFKRLTTLIHLKVINLGETILPALNIPCIKEVDFFDSVTPRGFAFDGEGAEGKGCKTPFGNRQTFELIQTPEKMAQYIAKDEEGQWWHEKEPHLPMELLTFTPLIDNFELIGQYQQKIEKLLDSLYKEGVTLRQYLAKQHLVKADMETFNPSLHILEKQGMFFKVKNDFYRFPHLALDRIALIKKLNAADTFTRIDQLEKQTILKGNAAEKLKEWMCIALFMRLKTYADCNGQRESLNPLIKPFGFGHPDLIKKQVNLDQETLEKIKKIFCTFIPFYQAIQAFIADNEESLKLSDLEDSSPQVQGYIALRIYHYDEAKKWFKKALEKNTENFQVLNELGLIYKVEQDLEPAAQYSNQALEIALKLFKEDDYLVLAAIYNNLSSICLDQEKFAKAEQYTKKALEIYTKRGNEERLYLAGTYTNLGLIYLKQGELKQASVYFNKALMIDFKLFGKNHPAVANDYNNMAMICQDQENLIKAMKFMRLAININRMFYGESHPTIALNYNNTI